MNRTFWLSQCAGNVDEASFHQWYCVLVQVLQQDGVTDEVPRFYQDNGLAPLGVGGGFIFVWGTHKSGARATR